MVAMSPLYWSFNRRTRPQQSRAGSCRPKRSPFKEWSAEVEPTRPRCDGANSWKPVCFKRRFNRAPFKFKDRLSEAKEKMFTNGISLSRRKQVETGCCSLDEVGQMAGEFLTESPLKISNQKRRQMESHALCIKNDKLL